MLPIQFECNKNALNSNITNEIELTAIKMLFCAKTFNECKFKTNPVPCSQPIAVEQILQEKTDFDNKILPTHLYKSHFQLL